MRIFDQRRKHILEKTIGDKAAIDFMLKTEGWKLLNKLLTEQLEAYKADMLLGVKNWDEYIDKRAKAWAINLLLTDLEDYIRQGEIAEQEVEDLHVS